MKKPLEDVSGTTLALTGLAILGAAAVVSTPVWIWYRSKRKRIDTLAGSPPQPAAEDETPAGSSEPPPQEEPSS
jgi:hypothetical protein